MRIIDSLKGLYRYITCKLTLANLRKSVVPGVLVLTVLEHRILGFFHLSGEVASN